MTKIGIRDLIYQVKRELLETRSDDPGPTFYVEGVDLDLSVVVEGEGSACINVYVVDLSSQIRKENTQTVKVSLRSLYTREELRQILEASPGGKDKLLDAVQKVMLKGGEG